MGLRPGHCYSNIDSNRAYTRIALSVPRKNYIGAVPGLKTRQFNMGNPSKNYSHVLDLVTGHSVNIRDNAIESARITINRFLNNKIGKDNYFMRIRIYPFHILRENKQAQGAGADRVSQGMSHAFGKPIGRAARVRGKQKIISILVNEEHVTIAKEALLRAKARMPTGLKVLIGTDVKSIGTRPKKVREAAEEKKEEKPVAGKEKKEGEAEGEKKEAGKEGKKEAKQDSKKEPKKEDKKK
ncbi:MAG: 50S ribosomal protein L16 [Candidatus Diapherotrites archaeon]|nr:50S ribosomal protein L16 [Candidatus Diapherotrites archaeon]